MVLCLPDSWSNWNLKMLFFEERGKPEYPEKNLSEQRREPTTNSTHIWRRRQDSNPGHIGGRRVLSPLHHPCSPPMLNSNQRKEKWTGKLQSKRDKPSTLYRVGEEQTLANNEMQQNLAYKSIKNSKDYVIA